MEKAQRMDELDLRLGTAMAQRIERDRVRAAHLGQRLVMQSPARQLNANQENVSQLTERLVRAAREAVTRRRERLEHTGQTLHVVSPLATLGRGYGIVQQENGTIVRDAGSLRLGEKIIARVAKGQIEANVISVNSEDQ